MIITLEKRMDFSNFYMFGNRNECSACRGVGCLIIYFICDVNMTSMSCDSVYCMYGAAWSSRWLTMQLTSAVVNMLACLWSCQRQIFWTYFVTINLFSLYLMNFMFHSMLNVAGDVLRVYNKSMKCDVSFSQGSVNTIFWWGGHFFIHV